MAFLWTTCQVGAEPALKKEIAREYPGLKFAYSRPGFVTFKDASDSLRPDFDLTSVFARASGFSLKKFPADPKVVLEFVQTLSPAPRHFHIFQRDLHAPGEEPKDFVADAWAKKVVAAFQPSAIPMNQISQAGDLVLDLVVVEEKEWWLGLHEVGAGLTGYPGGDPKIQLPAQAPSRAYVKLEEGIAFSKADVQAGQQVLDIGSAPGGASYALLKRGLKVVGVDPGQMDARVLAEKNFKHLQRTVAQIYPDELPESVHWILMDMNVKPNISLFAVDRFATAYKKSLKGMLLTIKLNEWKMADEIPQMLEHVRSMGMRKIRVTQLPSNGQEIFIAAFC